MMDLFEHSAKQSSVLNPPLAERMRPRNLEELIGQRHILGEGKLIRKAIEKDRIFSMILWGPPGCGKTTLARIIAKETSSHFVHFSAVLSGVKEIRSVVKIAGEQLSLYRKKTILFVDEIHRFNKAQQDAFLHHVESGLLTLIGATTENPSFEVIPPLMSRCRVITLKRLADDAVAHIIESAVADKDRGFGNAPWKLSPEALQFLIDVSDGDARTALNGLELTINLLTSERDAESASSVQTITLEIVETALQRKALIYDKSGEEHYNLISALHKSLRGSDPDAALYWLSRMLAAGEDPLYIARRMVRFSTEDVGNADPYALQMAVSSMEAYRFLGSPEGDLALAQAAVYLATAPKSNAVYAAQKEALKMIEKTGTLPTPFHIRNAPTRLMKSLGYGKGYKYAHEYKNAYVPQHYLPEKLRGSIFYRPTDRGYEKTIKRRLEKWRQMREHQMKEKNRDLYKDKEDVS